MPETEGPFRAYFIVNMPAVVQLNSGNICPKIRAFQPCILARRFARILSKITRIFIRKVPETEGQFRAYFIVNMPAVVQLNSGNFRPKIRAFQPCNLILRFARILRQIARIFIRKVPETGGAGAPPSPPGSYADASDTCNVHPVFQAEARNTLKETLLKARSCQPSSPACKWRI